MIYVLYEWTSREKLLVTKDKEKAYAKLGRLAYEEEENLEDIHLLEVDEENIDEEE